MDELVRRVAGVPLRELFARRVAEQIGAGRDVYLGLPPAEDARLLITVEPVRAVELEAQAVEAMALYDAWLVRHGLASIPSDVTLDRIARLEEVEAARRSGWASGAGIGNARGLARLYAALVSNVGEGRLITPRVVRAMSEAQVVGADAVFGAPSAFGVGYAVPLSGDEMAGAHSFGHGGAGGSIGFGHLEHELGVGFATDHVPIVPGADPIVKELTTVLLRCAGIDVRDGH
jgi:CubicO group peptidase (beta-lactamase class C family)